MEKAAGIGFGKYIITATTPFAREDLVQLGVDAPAVVSKYFPEYAGLYAQAGWKMLRTLDRVYVNARARAELGWRPRYDFAHVLRSIAASEDFRSPLAQQVGSKGYHPAA
jgi:UDP-glucose 4-epimerase